MKWPLHPQFASWLEQLLPSHGYGINVYPTSILTPSMTLPKMILSPSYNPKFKYHKELPLSHVSKESKKGRLTLPNLFQILSRDDYSVTLDIGKLGAKGDIDFFIGYSADSCAYRVYNRKTKKIMETMNVTFNELSAMAFEQSSSNPWPSKHDISGQISSGLDLT
ncbi:hypothetical protein Tco_1044509 [Tanacetum coccineum]|uniref:Retroviral polymerase SH3-like domain-containing protein n=1 Tax=Tanacetum coccineum TaxID=301880 RepID=A0ABQ5GQP0_9ASTR